MHNHVCNYLAHQRGQLPEDKIAGLKGTPMANTALSTFQSHGYKHSSVPDNVSNMSGHHHEHVLGAVV